MRPASARGILGVTMRFTDEPTHLWEIPEPLPVEIDVPCHVPALPEPGPAGA